MIISRLIGGLGNQMFQYAFGRSLSLELKTELRLDLSCFKDYKLHNGFVLGKAFNLPIVVANVEDMKSVLKWQNSRIVRSLLRMNCLSALRNESYILEKSFTFHPYIFNQNSNYYLHGYWQSEKYFVKYAEQIKTDFTFQEFSDSINRSIKNHINNSMSISIHVRRGDYISDFNANKIHGVVPVNFYISAMEYISSRVDSPEFFIFSDDIDWVKREFKNLNYKFHYILNNQEQRSFFDMALMSYCKHNIIANSSFSWWGAWLNNNSTKMVICPKGWFAADIDTFDLIPQNWVVL
jgi:hypothetical protein